MVVLPVQPEDFTKATGSKLSFQRHLPTQCQPLKPIAVLCYWWEFTTSTNSSKPAASLWAAEKLARSGLKMTQVTD
ncbi:MAG: hypothetical protein ACK456_01015 [Pseudanabaenaceae cyanobacterium]